MNISYIRIVCVCIYIYICTVYICIYVQERGDWNEISWRLFGIIP